MFSKEQHGGSRDSGHFQEKATSGGTAWTWESVPSSSSIGQIPSQLSLPPHATSGLLHI